MAHRHWWLDPVLARARGCFALLAALFAVAGPAAVLAVFVGLIAAPAASAATLSYASPTLTYTGVPTAEAVQVESLSATSVKYFGMAVNQIADPLPTGCTETNNPAQGQIVTCTISTLDHLSFTLGGGDDTLSASGLSKNTDISGGDGNDSIIGGSLSDVISGDAGVDTINSGPGADTLSVRDGLADTVNCGNGVDTLTGDTNDKLTGCEQTDLDNSMVTDKDGDGYSNPAAPGQPVDCDDTRADIHPGAVDVPGDGIDQDCSGADAVAPSGNGGTGSGTGSGTTGSGTGTTTTTNTGSGSGVTSTNNANASTGIGSNSNPTGIFGVVTTTNTNPGVTTTNTSTATGKDQGTVTSYGALIVAATPSITFKLIRKRGAAAYTRATKVQIAPVPAGATVSVVCKGRGCPKAKYTKTFSAGLAHLIVRSLFDVAKLQRGATITVRITKPGVIGRAVRYTVNAQNKPDSEASCLAAGTGVKTTC